MQGSAAPLPDPVTVRPRSGIVLTFVIAAFAIAGMVTLTLQGDGFAVVHYGLIAAAACYLCWLLFWYPCVTVDPSGVTVTNPARTYRVGWPALANVETRYALTLVTAAGKVVAWSAPAPGRYAASGTSPREVRHMDPDNFTGGSVRIGDVPGSESGVAAWHVRRVWGLLREAGYLDGPAVEGSGISSTWNMGPLLGGAALLGVGIVVAALLRG